MRVDDRGPGAEPAEVAQDVSAGGVLGRDANPEDKKGTPENLAEERNKSDERWNACKRSI